MRGVNQVVHLLLPIFCAAGFYATGSFAAAIPERGPIPFEAYDRDGNGQISEGEFYTVRSERMATRAEQGRAMRGAAGSPSFSEFDSDGDGQLTSSELAAGQQAKREKRRAMGKGQGRGMGAGQGRGRNMPSHADFDLNGDGVLEKDEFYRARGERFTSRMQQGYQARGMATAPTFEDVDSDGNGKVTPEEFSAHQAEHRKQRMRR